MRSAIVKVSAQPNRPGSYWTKEEQEVKVIEAYNKWIMRGAWSNAASKVCFYEASLIALHYSNLSTDPRRAAQACSEGLFGPAK